MNIQITSRKFRAKDTLKDFIKAELASLEKYNDEILETNVILSFTHLKESEKTAEIVVKIPGKTLTVSDSSEEFEKSISLAVEKLVKQLQKVKTKKLSSIR
ncbi:MAG: ribosome-associated translation inhibitor RaiA [bacterium]